MPIGDPDRRQGLARCRAGMPRDAFLFADAPLGHALGRPRHRRRMIGQALRSSVAAQGEKAVETVLEAVVEFDVVAEHVPSLAALWVSEAMLPVIWRCTQPTRPQ